MSATVLVVDDHAETSEILGRLLEGRRLHVIALLDSLRALELLHEGLRPQALVTDERMPILLGTELIAALRSIRGLEQTPVLLLSASEMPKTDEFTLVRQKPLEPELFVDLVDQLARPG